MLRSKIAGLGSFAPERVVTNEELAFLDERHVRQPTQQTETSDAWIRERSGIEERRYAAEGVGCSDLALEASRRAIEDAGIDAAEIDCIILGTLSPDIHFPGTAVFLQEKLGLTQLPACYDIRQQCSAFLYGLQMADALIRAGTYRRILLVGSEVHSAALEYSTRGRDVMVLFGDAAGAAVIVPEETDDPRAGVVYTQVAADGSGAWDLYMKVFEIERRPFVGYDARNLEENSLKYPQMNGRKVFTNAVKRMTEASLKALAETGLSWDDVDWFVAHQANLRITEAVMKHARIPPDKVLNSIQQYGNTTAATIPLTLDLHYRAGTVKRGDLVLASVFGSGYTWGAAVFRIG